MNTEPLESRVRLLFGALLGVLLLSTTSVALGEESPAPSTDLTPQEVVSIVVEALRTNDPADGDTGIATVFRFASPANRSQTGPLTRFNRMIKVGFSDMLNHLSSRRDAMEVADGVALQAVWLIGPGGRETGYMFRLGKQESGDYAGMWLTDAVYPLGPGDDGQVI